MLRAGAACKRQRVAAAAALVVTPRSPVGAEVSGVCLRDALENSDTSAALAERLRAELDRHGLLIFRDQQSLRPLDHLSLARCLGKVFELPPRFQHGRSPHRDILRISNTDDEGFKGVGTTGWHIDGSSYSTPFGYSLMHIVHSPKRGPTLFLPLHRLARHICEQRPDWERLSMRSGSGDKTVVHPLLYAHPRTQRPAVCLGKTSGFFWDRGTTEERLTDAEETTSLLDDLNARVEECAAKETYQHDWEAGDVVVLDNLAVAHLAAADTQESPESVGLRVLHRVVVAGTQALRGIVKA